MQISTYPTRAIISRGLYIFTPFFTAAYIVERLVLQTIYVLNKKILQFLSLKSAVYSGEWVVMEHVRYIEYGLNIFNLQMDRALESVPRPNVLKAPDF